MAGHSVLLDTASAIPTTPYRALISEEAYQEYTSNLEQVTLTIGDARMATLILPFDAIIPDGLKVYSCSNPSTVNGTTYATLTEERSIAANTPYIVAAESGFSTTFQGESTATATTYTAGMLTGTFEATTVPVRRGVKAGEALEGLGRGIYIVNGVKKIVK